MSHAHMTEAWLTALRIVDVAMIALSVGFLWACALRAWDRTPRFVKYLGASWSLYALGAAAHASHATLTGAGDTWRAVVVTAAAVTGLLSAVWAYAFVSNGKRRNRSDPGGKKGP